MPMAAGSALPTDHAPPMAPTMVPMQSPPVMVSDSFAKDAIISWFRSEFAAANAVIDALCGHLAQLSTATGASDYDSVFSAIHRRRLNWIPVIQMQKYHPIAEVAVELRKVAEKKTEAMEKRQDNCKSEDANTCSEDSKKINQKIMDVDGNGSHEAPEGYDSPPESEITDSGSQEMQGSLMNSSICSNHEECEGRGAQIKLTKGFSAKESIKGHMVNVVKGLKLYEDVFSDSELCKLYDFVNEIHSAGQNGELSGETFILFNKQMKGNKRELIQLGVPIFQQIKEDARSNIEPIPALLISVIDHLTQWKLLPEYKRPNSCIINFFEEGEYSQPFLKPPHLDQPVSTLLLSESTMAFGRALTSDSEGNYKGPLKLSPKNGSLLVMRGNSADIARHVMCPSPNRRVSISFFRVKPDSNQSQTSIPSMATAMTVWQTGIASPYALANGAISGNEATSMDMNVMPKWGITNAPMVMLTPVRPMVLSSRKLPRGGSGVGGGGTGVFLPWNVPSRKHAKHLPPRAQKGRLLALPPPVESHSHMEDSTSDSTITVEAQI